jgi:phage tail-like protein
MNDESGYRYLNLGNEWPLVARHRIAVTPEGSLELEQINGAFVEAGVFRAGPFEVVDGPTQWHRLRVDGVPLPEGTHLQLFTFAATDGHAPYDPTDAEPFGHPGWRAAPRDVRDILIPHPPARRLWVGGLLRSDGHRTPSIRQIRVDYGEADYLKRLPAVYSRNEPSRHFLNALLSLYASVLGGLEDRIDDLPRLFDPQAVPDSELPSWLAWLADCLAFRLNEAWDEAQTRDYLAQAIELYGRRGTVEGLRRYLKWYAGVEAQVVEPGLQTHLWTLGESSALGLSTVLAPAHLQGAVLDSSATLNGSHLGRHADPGAALSEDRAHQFCVRVYCAELNRPGALEDAKAVIEREKPAHTSYELCVIEPRMRVGIQAQVGVDAIVGQGPPPAHVGMVMDTGVLSEQAEDCHQTPRRQEAGSAPCTTVEKGESYGSEQ